MKEKISPNENCHSTPEQLGNIVQLKSSKDNLKMKVCMSASLQLLSKHSDKHFRCACLCAQSCVEIEDTHQIGEDQQIQNEKYQRDQAFATGSIMSIVAYLESTINELFSDCVNKSGKNSKISHIDESIIGGLVEYWNKTNLDGRYENRFKRSILEKYLDAYKTIKGKGSHYHSKYYQEIDALIDLRNILVHYEPKWQYGKPHSDDPYNINKLDGKFPSNKFYETSGNPFFPYKCLGAGCTIWAIIISEEFVKEFFSIIGIDPGFPFVDAIKKEILGKNIPPR